MNDVSMIGVCPMYDVTSDWVEGKLHTAVLQYW